MKNVKLKWLNGKEEISEDVVLLSDDQELYVNTSNLGISVEEISDGNFVMFEDAYGVFGIPANKIISIIER